MNVSVVRCLGRQRVQKIDPSPAVSFHIELNIVE